ncbi:MAG: AsmA family protein [Bdellovibrionales bacterium]
MKKGRVLRVFFLLVAFVIGCGGAYIASFDPNAYRDELARLLSEKTGRHIQLGGALSLTLSKSLEVMLDVKDVRIGNPSWASREDMAHVGRLRFGLDLRPLFEKKISISTLLIEDVQAQLESNTKGQNNWSFQAKETASTGGVKAGAKNDPVDQRRVSFHIQEAQILNNKIGFRSPDGKVTLMSLPRFTLRSQKKSTRLEMVGILNDLPLQLTLKGAPLEQWNAKQWPFDMKAMVGSHKLEATGSIAAQGKQITFSFLSLYKGEHQLSGSARVSFQNVVPSLYGRFKANSLDSSFLALSGAAMSGVGQAASSETVPSSSEKGNNTQLFSRAAFDLEGLRKGNVDLAFEIKRWQMSGAHVDNVDLRVKLKNGALSVPFLADIGGAPAKGELVLRAALETPAFSFSLNAAQINLTKLIDYQGVDRFVTGRADVGVSLHSSGNSPYQLASLLRGNIDILLDTDAASSSVFNGFMGQALGLFVPGFNAFLEAGVNCMAAHYVVKNGVVETKGFLADTQMTTIAGEGLVNLPDERINLNFKTKAKGVGSIIPPMKIYGPLTSPQYAMESKGVLNKVLGMVVGEETHSEGVPDVVAVAGKNACEVALMAPVVRPAVSSGTQNSILPGTAGKIEDTIRSLGKNIGGPLLEQLKLFGN